MPWNENNSDGKTPPDISELISSLKGKIRNALKSRYIPSEKNIDEKIKLSSCSCDTNEKSQVIDVSVYCDTCSKILGKKSFKRPYEVAAIIVVLSYGASQFVDYAITDNRYPINVEYAVIDSCVNFYEQPLEGGIYDHKKKICLCALEDTMNEISYARFNVDRNGFLSAFEENAAQCIDQRGKAQSKPTHPRRASITEGHCAVCVFPQYSNHA